jgi:hypothetical protein
VKREELDDTLARILARALVNAVREEEKDAAVLRPRDVRLDKNASGEPGQGPPLAA